MTDDGYDDDLGPYPPGYPGGRELDAFIGDKLPDPDWLVPDFLERGDRLILTGTEGAGKSTLLRQWGVQLASGVHPFGGADFRPLRVLLPDMENSQRQMQRKLHPIRAAAGRRYAGGMVIEVRTEGLDLLNGNDGDWFLSLVKEHHPDVLITGPAYKMAGGDPTEEMPAKVVSGYFDRLRSEHGCAVLLEAHTPHASNGGKRPMRPYGASLWLRWPEFGVHLGDDGVLTHWRSPRDERDWPAALQRGGDWPWTPVGGGDRQVAWIRIKALCQAEGRMSEQKLADRLGLTKSTIHRAIAGSRNEWDTLPRGTP